MANLNIVFEHNERHPLRSFPGVKGNILGFLLDDYTDIESFILFLFFCQKWYRCFSKCMKPTWWIQRLHFKELDTQAFTMFLAHKYLINIFWLLTWCVNVFRGLILGCSDMSMRDALNLLSSISLRELRLYKEPLLCNVCVCVCDKTERLNTALIMMMMFSTLSYGVTSKCTQHGNYLYFFHEVQTICKL